MSLVSSLFLFSHSVAIAQDEEGNQDETSEQMSEQERIQLKRYLEFDQLFERIFMRSIASKKSIALYLLGKPRFADILYQASLKVFPGVEVSHEEFRENLRRLSYFLRFHPGSEVALLEQLDNPIVGDFETHRGKVLAIQARRIHQLLFLSKDIRFGDAEYHFRTRAQYRLYIGPRGYALYEDYQTSGELAYVSPEPIRFMRWRPLYSDSSPLNQRTSFQDFDEWLRMQRKLNADNVSLYLNQLELPKSILEHPAVFTGLWTKDPELHKHIGTQFGVDDQKLQIQPKDRALTSFFKGPKKVPEDQEPLERSDPEHIAEKQIIGLSMELTTGSFARRLQSQAHEIAPRLSDAVQQNLPARVRSKVYDAILGINLTPLDTRLRREIANHIFFKTLVNNTESPDIKLNHEVYAKAFEAYLRIAPNIEVTFDNIWSLANDAEMVHYFIRNGIGEDLPKVHPEIKAIIYGKLRDLIKKYPVEFEHIIVSDLRSDAKDRRPVALRVLAKLGVSHDYIIAEAVKLIHQPLEGAKISTNQQVKNKSLDDYRVEIARESLRYLKSLERVSPEAVMTSLRKLLARHPEHQKLIEEAFPWFVVTKDLLKTDGIVVPKTSKKARRKGSTKKYRPGRQSTDSGENTDSRERGPEPPEDRSDLQGNGGCQGSFL